MSAHIYSFELFMTCVNTIILLNDKDVTISVTHNTVIPSKEVQLQCVLKFCRTITILHLHITNNAACYCLNTVSVSFSS